MITKEIRSIVEALIGKEYDKGKERFVVNNLPKDILDLFYKETEFLQINGIKVPFFILDDENGQNIDIEKLDVKSKITKDVANTIRTKSIGEKMVVLFAEPGINLHGSLDTSIQYINVSWENVITNLLKQTSLSGSFYAKLFKQVINKIPFQSKASKNYHFWKTAKELGDFCSVRQKSLSDEDVLAFAGIPRPKEITETGVKESLNFADKNLFDTIERVGFFNFLDEFYRIDEQDVQIEENVRESLDRFKKEIIQNGNILEIPRKKFEAIRTTDRTVWWDMLGVDTWETLLDSLTEDELADIKIQPVNKLDFEGKNNVYLFQSNVQLKIRDDETLAEWYVGKKKLFEGEKNSIDIAPSQLSKNKPFDKISAKSMGKQRSLKVFSFEGQDCPIFFIFKGAKKVKDRKFKDGIYLQEVALEGIGNHELDIYVSENVNCKKIEGREISSTSEQDSFSVPKDKPVKGCQLRKYHLAYFSDESCHYLFQFNDGENDINYKVEFTAEDNVETSVENYFQRLKYENVYGDSRIPSVSAKSSKILDLGSHYFKKPKSYLPAVISYDFADFELKGEENAIFSKAVFMNSTDPRPWENLLADENITELADLRWQLAEVIKEDALNSEDDAGTVYIETLQLAGVLEGYENLIQKYLHKYYEILASGNSLIWWFDTISIVPNVTTFSTDAKPSFENKVLGLFLSPLHPVCLSWQYYAQQTMSGSSMCPTASHFNPSDIPQVWQLKSAITDKNSSFVSLNTNYDYWRLYWKADELGTLMDIESHNKKLGIFFSDLRINFSIREETITSRQVEKSLSQTQNILPAKNRLNVSILGSGDQSGEVNAGILNWSKNNLGGSSHDGRQNVFTKIWNDANPYGLEVYDHRKDSSKINPSTLSYYTSELEIPLNWYDHHQKKGENDLAIISKLITSNHFLLEDRDLNSVLAPGALYRFDFQYFENHNIHKSIITRASEGDTTSKDSSDVHKIGVSNLDTLLQSLVTEIEKQFFEVTGVNKIMANPSSQFISEGFKEADLCAVSSSLVDLAYLVSSAHNDQNLMVWQYDLPDYGIGLSGSDGYYLFSELKKYEIFTENIRAFDNTIRDISEDELNNHFLLLGNKGLTNLRNILHGGVSFTGELGMLIAQLVLQPPKNSEKFEGAFPLEQENQINLLVPIDPFEIRINTLRKFLKRKDSTIELGENRRPDFLLLSISEDFIKVDCLEVKCRSGFFDQKQMQDALQNQAGSFLKFLSHLAVLYDNAGSHFAWRFALPSLLQEMISFSLGLYLVSREISRAQLPFLSRVMFNMLNGKTRFEIEQNGKLISISDRNVSSVFYDKTVFSISKNQIHSLLRGEFNEFVSHVIKGEFLSLTFDKVVKNSEKKKVFGNDEVMEPKISAKEENGAMDIPEENPQIRPERQKKLTTELLEDKYLNILSVLEEHNTAVNRVDGKPYLEGPAFILFRLTPKTGVRVSKVESYHDELKLALRLTKNQNIRFEIDAGYINLYVPKSEEERYFIKADELWSSWEPSENQLEIAIGEGLTGNTVSINFSSSNSPHLLVGGQTGSGKTEALNTMLYGITKYFGSKEVNFILVDPKGTELQGFEGSDYLGFPIGINDVEAIEYLEYAIEEMDRRYETMTSKRVRNLKGLNKQLSKDEKIPWLLIVLDEYGDLTSSPDSKKKIEQMLIRIAQKGRASGIHLVITTQNPTADVISSNVRSNLGAQLALKVRGGTESRIILTETGAESLNGKGDALFNTARGIERLQVALFTPD